MIRRPDRAPFAPSPSALPSEVNLLSNRALPEHVPRPRLLPNPRPRSNAGARLIGGLVVVLVASSMTMASASAVGALIDEPGTDADARIVSDSHAPPAQFDGLTPGDPARWNIGTQLEGTELSVPAAESADLTASADSTETADSTASADSAETADSAANSTEPADPGMVRPAILATTGGNLIPLALLAAGLTCIGVSAVMTRRRTVPTATAQLPVLTDRDAP